jgi:beta-lactam-binding protein with PASTA domain
MFIKAKSLKDVFLHLVIMLALFVGAVVFFFYGYLPFTTNHGETIEVPSMIGKTLPEIETMLSAHHLRYQVNDSSYVPNVKPFTILSQHPTQGSKVKKNRKIYLSVSAPNPPKIKIPELLDLSLKSAEISLKGSGLVLGQVKTVPSPYHNLVVNQSINGKTVKAGDYIAKGTKVDISVGDGSKAIDVAVPDLVGQDLEEAKATLVEIGLDLGLTEKDNNSSSASGTITKQSPSSGTLKTGGTIDVWTAR